MSRRLLRPPRHGDQGFGMAQDTPDAGSGITHEIVARIQGGDAAAWNDLWGRLHDDLLFCIRCRLGPGLRRHLESEDIFQSIALEALGEIPKFTPRSPGSLRHFFHLLATRKIQNRAETFGARKRAGTRPLDAEAMGIAGPRYRDPDRYEKLENALARLEADEREVVLLHRVEGVPTKEVAERMGRSDAAVRKLYSRSLARLREILGGPG
jgi:RNA polymerase sigma-70 factor (ECF subfamily)